MTWQFGAVRSVKVIGLIMLAAFWLPVNFSIHPVLKPNAYGNESVSRFSEGTIKKSQPAPPPQSFKLRTSLQSHYIPEGHSFYPALYRNKQQLIASSSAGLSRLLLPEFATSSYFIRQADSLPRPPNFPVT